MNEPTERIDRGTWWHDGGDSATSGEVLSGLPMGDYRIYAEPVVEEPLNERMAHYWGGWWGPAPSNGLQRAHRMQMLIDEFGLVERSKLPDPPDVPDDVKEAATFVSSNGWGAGSVENVDTIVRWVLEQVGDSDG
ncbi:MAG: hypothetical protein GY698_24520 [Actinomycetia bacterium]|nr:hypothetical protein [Actinomycetes bacterium]